LVTYAIFRRPLTAAAPPSPHTLSLHDALPICAAGDGRDLLVLVLAVPVAGVDEQAHLALEPVEEIPRDLRVDQQRLPVLGEHPDARVRGGEGAEPACAQREGLLRGCLVPGRDTHARGAELLGDLDPAVQPALLLRAALRMDDVAVVD